VPHDLLTGLIDGFLIDRAERDFPEVDQQPAQIGFRALRSRRVSQVACDGFGERMR
jgi:hypothetical protein